MKNTIKYKDYIGSVEFSEEDGVFFGKVQGINALVSYEGRNAEELLKDFHDAVDDYLLFCEQTNADPEIAYKGSFNVRIKPALHERLAIIAMNQGKALNNCAQEAIENYVNQFI